MTSPRVLRAMVAAMAVAAVIWLSYQFWRLLWGEAPIWASSPSGAIDLKILHGLVRDWMAGVDVYVKDPTRAFYPPASHLLLWPLFGWVDVTPARYLWAATSGAVLWWMAASLTAHSRATTALERTFIGLLPVSCYAAGGTIGNGQLGLHVLGALLAGLLLLRRPVTWRNDALAALLLIFALVKPSLTVPFFWLVVSLPGRLRPALLVVAGYGAATWAALSLQSAGPTHLAQAWLSNVAGESAVEGYADVARLLSLAGAEGWIPLVSFAMLVAAGVWVHLSRTRDIWLLIGVLALVSRFWAHHRWYDDILVVVAVVAVFRFRHALAARIGRVSDALLLLSALTLLAPGGLYVFPTPWHLVYVAVQVATWVALLCALLWLAAVNANPSPAGPDPL